MEDVWWRRERGRGAFAGHVRLVGRRQKVPRVRDIADPVALGVRLERAWSPAELELARARVGRPADRRRDLAGARRAARGRRVRGS